MELVKFNNEEVREQGRHRYEAVETELFRLREAAENIWIRIAELCSEVVEYKLYKYARDEEGNYFRTSKAYFEWLDHQWEQRGWHARPSTLNNWMSTYRLLVKEMGFTSEDVAALGITNAKVLAPALRQLQKEGRGEEALQVASELITASQVNDGVPLSEVNSAISFLTGKVDKGLEVKFEKRIFGHALSLFRLWWGGKPVDLLAKQQVTDEQRDWVLKRLGQRPE